MGRIGRTYLRHGVAYEAGRDRRMLFVRRTTRLRHKLARGMPALLCALGLAGVAMMVWTFT